MNEQAADAFAAFYEQAYRAVYRYVLLRGGPRDDVDDVVADAFHRAFRAWLAGQGPREVRQMAWILAIARRVLIDRARRRGREVDERGEPGLDLPDARWEQAVRETWLWFEDASQAISSQAREALVLRYAGGLTADEIGSVLGLSGSGVRSLIARALATLRPAMEADR